MMCCKLYPIGHTHARSRAEDEAVDEEGPHSIQRSHRAIQPATDVVQRYSRIVNPWKKQGFQSLRYVEPFWAVT